MTQKTERQKDRVTKRRDYEHQNIFALLPATYSSCRSQALQFLRLAGDLSVVEWRTLWDLHETGPATVSDLAEIQRIDHSILSRALPDMRRKGYVTTKQNATDKRETIVAIAAAGRDKFNQAAPVMQKRWEALRAAFTPEDLAQFIDMLERLDKFFNLPLDEILPAGTV